MLQKKYVMEKIFRVSFLFFFSFILMPSYAVGEKKDFSYSISERHWKPVIEAIIQVESNGKCNARCGASVGVMQITPIFVAECNNILKSRKSKKRYKLSDRMSRQKSIEMFLLFQSWFNPKNDVELAIRSWNGGMNYSVKRTQQYFNKVMKILKNNH